MMAHFRMTLEVSLWHYVWMPFSKDKVQYSMTPITLSLLNLPRHIRNQAASMFLVGIIPGKSEPADTDPYLDILVDDIIEINDTSIYDAYREEFFKLKVSMWWTILDRANYFIAKVSVMFMTITCISLFVHVFP